MAQIHVTQINFALAVQCRRYCDNSYPTSWWSPGEIVEETRWIQLPPDLSAGDYYLSTGWYDWSTGRRLSLDSGGEHLILARVRVMP